LKFLAQHAGRVFSRAQLLQEVWGYDYFGGTRTVDVHVRRLRAKLGTEYEVLIGTVRNVGYKFVKQPPGGSVPTATVGVRSSRSSTGVPWTPTRPPPSWPCCGPSPRPTGWRPPASTSCCTCGTAATGRRGTSWPTTGRRSPGTRIWT